MVPENWDNAQFIFRTIKESDIPAIIELYKKAILPIWLERGRAHDFERIENNIRLNINNNSYIMKILGIPEGSSGLKPIGYIAWEIHPDHTSKHIIAHLRMLLVHPNYRRRGFAEGLIKDFEREAHERGCTKILFDVLKGSPANEFYQKLGFLHWSNYMEKYL